MAPPLSRFLRHPSPLLWTSTVVAGLITLADRSGSAKGNPVDDLIEQGVRLRMEDQPAAALELFERAHALAPSARTLAQIGLAEGALHRWLDAEAHITSALDLHDILWIESQRNRDALEQALTAIRRHIGGIVVLGPRGASISVNGRPKGALPLDGAVRVEEGQAHVEGTAVGFTSADVDVAVLGGRDVTVVLEMVPVAAATTAMKAPVSAPPPRAEVSPRWRMWGGVSLVGASLGALGAGIAWLALDGSPACSAPSGSVCNHVHNTELQGWIAIGAGVAGGLGGGYLIWSGRRASATVDVGLGSLGLRGRF